MLFLFCVVWWFILRGAPSFKVCPCSLSACFVIPFGIVITSLGEDGADLCASRAFVLYMLVLVIFLFLLVSGVWLRFVIVAFPGLFYELFCFYWPFSGNSDAVGFLYTLC